MVITFPDVSVVVVSFNVCGLLDQCLSSVLVTNESLDIEIIVVDNASEDGTVSMVRNKYPEVKLIRNEDNRGFAEANNQGLAIAKGEYVFVLNPDTIVLPGAITRLVQFMKETDDAGVVGPKLLNSDGSIQSSCQSFPNLLNYAVFSFWSYRLLPTTKHPYRFALGLWNHSGTAEVDWVLGAAMMLRREVIQEVGGLDDDYFLYSEEKDWCFRIWQSGHKVYFLPEARVIHYGGQSATQTRRRSVRELYRSLMLFVEKHYSPSYANLLKSILLAGIPLKLTFNLVRSFVFGNRRYQARSKTLGLLDVLVEYVFRPVPVSDTSAQESR